MGDLEVQDLVWNNRTRCESKYNWLLIILYIKSKMFISWWLNDLNYVSLGISLAI